MPFPAAFLGSTTATEDVVTGPGAPSVLIGGMPASTEGDAVAGAACVGVITVGSPTVLWMGRPASRVTSTVFGENPETAVEVTTAVAVGSPTVLIP